MNSALKVIAENMMELLEQCGANYIRISVENGNHNKDISIRCTMPDGWEITLDKDFDSQ